MTASNGVKGVHRSGESASLPRQAHETPDRKERAFPVGGDKGPLLLHSTPNYLFWCLHKTSMSLVTEELERAGADLTPVQYAALTAVHAYPGIDQGSLAYVIGYDRATIGGVIDRLEKKGLIVRRIQAHDRRARALFLEPAGEELLPGLEDKVALAQARILAPLGEDEREHFLATVAKLIREDLPHSLRS